METAMEMFEKKKVFDCQDMPEDVKEVLFTSREGVGNDCYVNWYCEEEDVVTKWLLENGAKKDEEVIISHWW